MFTLNIGSLFNAAIAVILTIVTTQILDWHGPDAALVAGDGLLYLSLFVTAEKVMPYSRT